MIKIIDSRIDASIVEKVNEYLNPQTHRIVINSSGGDLYYAMLLCIAVKAYNDEVDSDSPELGIFPVPRITLESGAFCGSAAAMIFVYAKIMGVPTKLNDNTVFIAHSLEDRDYNNSYTATTCREFWRVVSSGYTNSNGEVVMNKSRFAEILSEHF